VVGPWAEDDEPASSSAGLVGGDRVLAMRLVNLEPNRVYTRSEALCDDDTRGADGLTEAERATEAVARFCRSDGAELVLGLRSVTPLGALPETALARAREIGPYIAECWATGWKSEPEWVRTLKPSARRVLQLVLDGLDDDQIAEDTGLTYHSVRAHLKRLFKEAGVRSRLHLMQAYRSGARVVESDELLAAV
jgi:DNA-binding CsgD family transcriptional regulator